ncbi:hypothetical protein E2C01_068856 [Portunus trituberculatus]|uniref:Uncharacterized protein n=1 Tax=Portunus trituberculatus TaxID=210409 RepID=A0A5B7HXN3_PORTR|nr:hypothetical protein [Portunus trituberculatus]
MTTTPLSAAALLGPSQSRSHRPPAPLSATPGWFSDPPQLHNTMLGQMATHHGPASLLCLCQLPSHQHFCLCLAQLPQSSLGRLTLPYLPHGHLSLCHPGLPFTMLL